MIRADFYVYVLFRHDTGEPFYVGKGKGDRLTATFRPHVRPSHKDRIVALALAAGADVPRVKIAVGLTERAALDLEISIIAAVGRGQRGPLVNMTDGGEGTSGIILSPAGRARRSVALIGKNVGKKRSLEHIAQMSERQIGNQFAKGNRFNHTPEAIAAISAGLKDKPKPPRTETHKAAYRAAIDAPEHREKLSKAQLALGRKDTPEQLAEKQCRMKGNQFAKGKTWTLSDETKSNQSLAVKKRREAGWSPVQSPEQRAAHSAFMKELWRRKKGDATEPII